MDPADPADHIRALDRKFFAACRARDAGAFADLLADDFVVTDPGDLSLTRSEWIAAMTADGFTFEVLEPAIERVSVADDLAIVFGRVEARSRPRTPQPRYDGQYGYTNVYRRRDGAWRLVLAAGKRLDGAH